jgi:hypothetical protein
MSHWFDRLASWSAEGRDEGEEPRLTRRRAVVATAGVGVAGVLGSPLVSRVFAEDPGCGCARQVNREFEKEAGKLERKYLNNGNGVLSLVTVPYFLLAYSGLVTGAFLAQQHRCGVSGSECKKVPSGKPPPPNKQPCTQRGGLRLRGDQCAPPGGAGAEVGGCAAGTSSCPTPGGGDLCCFGSDVCCSGCCCIAEVGCGCCGE